MADSLALTTLGWVTSSAVAKLHDGFIKSGINAEEKLKELKKLKVTILPQLKSVIERADGSEYQSKMEEDWLRRLKDACDDAEDALDLLNYQRLKRKAKAASSRRKRRTIPIRVRSLFRSHPVPRYSRCVTPIIKICRDMLSPRKIKLRRRLERLEEIAHRADKLCALLGVQPETAVPDSRQTISRPPPKVFGREKDCEEVIRLLTALEPAAIPEPGPAGIPITAIVGRPGVGKTTLAQYVCEKLRSKGNKHFDLVMWVYASSNFKASEIMKSIIQQASIASKPQDPDDLPTMIHRFHTPFPIAETTAAETYPNSLQLLEQKMDEKLNSKRFLLVIDDVWCEQEDHVNNWKALRCLNKCLPGSKILVTSQTSHAPRKIGSAIGATTENIYYLKELEENDFLDLFIHHALPSPEIDSHLREELEEIGKKIARKLDKDPTAAEMVGLCLQDDLEVRYWRDTAQKDWSGNKTEALLLSYQHLPAYLRRCFSYLTLYPKGYKFKDVEVFQLWMAQGFIEPADQKERMEDAGSRYLKELVSRFYIQHHDSYYTLHDLLYDLAETVSSKDCLRIEGNHQKKIPSTIRHLCIPVNKLNENKEDICELKKLRTLIVTEGESVTSEENVATDIFKSLKKLRVLVLELNPENLAKFIGKMKHLRILQVADTSEFVLPKSVCTLYQLQVLRIKNARLLPECLNNFISLKYLNISAIPDVSKLTSLQGLEEFQVRKEKGYELEQLQNLNELQGCLRISNLENVESKESVIAANLKEKKYLDTLQLVWCDGEDNLSSNLDAEILEGVQLPPNLTSLLLDGYRGWLWPSWPESKASNIEELVLKGCRMLEELPPMDWLYPSCRSLELDSLPRLKALHIFPPKLTKLGIENTPLLTFVTKGDLQMSQDEKRSIIEVMRNRTHERFPHQHKEDLVRNEREMRNFIAEMNGSSNEASTPEHTSVPADMDITAGWERWLQLHERKMKLIYKSQNEAKLLLPSTLTRLRLKGCNITNQALLVCLQNLTSLTELSLEDIRTITCLPSVEVMHEFKALKYVNLSECWALTSLGAIGSLPRLKELYLSGCPCLDGGTAFLPSSLESITFIFCVDVDDILANADLPRLSRLRISQCDMRTASLLLSNLRSLHFLIIDHCSGLSSLVDVQKLRSLESLSLQNCANLQAVMNLPRSLTSLEIRGCPILEERFVKIDPLSGKRMLDDFPVEASFSTCYDDAELR